MNQPDEGHKRKILIGVACGILLIAGAITAAAWPRSPKPVFVPHVQEAEVDDQEEVVEELKVRELRERPKNRRDDGDPIKDPRSRKKKENKKIPLPQPVAGLP